MTTHPNGPVQTRLIAFCGIDGAGKSTLVRRLAAEAFLPDAVFLHKSFSATADLVKRHHPRPFRDGREYLGGSFAHAVAFASTLDFVHHYHENIRPHLGHRRFVVADRYSLCYQAYARSAGAPLDVGGLLAEVRPPDLVVYVTVPPEVAVGRYEQRGGAGEDENAEVMVRFDRAYRELLPVAGAPVATLRNEGAFDDTYAALRRALAPLLEDAGAHGG